MNNDCDNAGLWVVKFNRFVLRKINMPDTLPKPFIWNDTTRMLREMPNTHTDCVMILKQYIHNCCVANIESVQCEPRSDTSKDVDNLVKDLRQTNEPNSHHLVAIQDMKVSELDLVTKLDEVTMRSQKNLLLLLPASACLGANLTTKGRVHELLERAILGEFEFNCITSMNVTETPVSLVLVHIKGTCTFIFYIF